MIADASQRAAAIKTSQSCIVQAPAGSGKTELLIQRFLALLGSVERPNQILAITFTRKAAAEMRHRLLKALQLAKDQPCPEQAHEAKTWQLARAALAHQGDDLLRNPAQLSIQTIDSFNASLVRKMPWLSRFGALPELAEDAEQLYQQAAEQLLQRLDHADAAGAALCRLLGHLDNHVGHLQQLLVDMLKRRDQWLRHLLKKAEDPRYTLESALAAFVSEHLQQLASTFPTQYTDELLFCCRFAAANLPASDLDLVESFPGVAIADTGRWQALADLLLTGTGQLRKTVTVKNGFPAGNEHAPAKQRMLDLLAALSASPAFVQQLARVRNLPNAGYAENQWQILQCLVQLLPLLVAELWLVFRAQGKTDFAAIALQAKAALGDADNPTELLLKTDNDLRHILVDEFQDTSWLQYELLGLLTSGWTPGDGRTLFLVGDPMQSIYRFREAEVGLFLDTFSGRLGKEGPILTPLQLSCNFRSQQGVVSWVNQTFSQIFPQQIDIASGAVPLARATAVHPELTGPACTMHPFAGRDDQAEAEQVLRLVQQARKENPQQKIAILVRGRNHLRAVLPLLRRHGLKYQAQDIDLLGDRPLVFDLLSLCRALLQRADRLAWLSVLRAPWCGLSLADLHVLSSAAGPGTLPGVLQDAQRLQTLSKPGQAAIARVWPRLQRALGRHGRLSMRDLLEGCWLSLGGPACYPSEHLADAELMFALLEKLQQGGELPSVALLEDGLQKLFAAVDSDADDRLQIMTIHKAKGLQFDTVIVPGLGKMTGRIESPLLRWHEHPRHGLLLAPVSARGSAEKDPIYQLIGRLEQEKQQLEAARLLYVATTRAISRLHLLGHAKYNSRDELKPASGSLLETLWPAVEPEFVAAAVDCQVEEELFVPPRLRRLPEDWQLPELTRAMFSIEGQQKTASQKDDDEEQVPIFSGWESEAKRHIGTLVHQYLEQLARHGQNRWRQRETAEKELIIGRQLAVMGVPNSELANGVRDVIIAVENTLASEKGKWLLSAHPQQACELALTGVVEGELVHKVIDRTFVAEGSRWVVDYKTTTKKNDETLAAFISRQKQQYHQQLQTYAELMKLQSDDLPIRKALYFPLIDDWCEL